MTLAIIIGVGLLGMFIVAGIYASRGMRKANEGKKGPDGSGADGPDGADGGGDGD
jgi:hypothetical protein